jgi:hypothetical protein
MKRVLGLATALLMTPAIGVTLATTASASGAIPTVVTPNSFWTITTPKNGCESMEFLTHHEFAADQAGDAGLWKEPAHTKITITWTTGANVGTVFKGTFNAAHDTYKGKIVFPGFSPSSATLIPGSKTGC